MSSQSFVRALLVGAGVILVLVLSAIGYRHLTGEPPVAVPANFDPAQFVRGRPRLDAPYVVTDYQVVDAMLALAQVRPDDHVIDLGSGDGRILVAAARSHGARGLGVEIDPARIREAEANARAAGVGHRVSFRRQDLFETPLQEADVLTLYLTPEVNQRLRPRILSQMRPGTRVVSHDYDMGDWRWDTRQRVGAATIYLWIIPANAAGRWNLSLEGEAGTLELRQHYQEIEGTLTLGGETVRIAQGRVAGDRIFLLAHSAGQRRVLEGRIVDNRIEPLSGDSWRAVRAG